MKERPILFNGEKVRAILDGRKTQDRRPVKAHGNQWVCDIIQDVTDGVPCFEGEYGAWHNTADSTRNPFGQPGDVLWVRESAKVTGWLPHQKKIELEFCDGETWTGDYPGRMKWKPQYGHKVPNGCYKEACRLKLKVKRVWVEGVQQDMSNEDAIAEGIRPFKVLKDGRVVTWCAKDNTATFLPKVAFADLWNSIYGTWGENPWVWCCEFEVIKAK